MLRNKRSIMSCLIRVWHIPILAFLVMMYVHAGQPAAVPPTDPVHAIDQSGENRKRLRQYHNWIYYFIAKHFS